jgi:hypothetical protein
MVPTSIKSTGLAVDAAHANMFEVDMFVSDSMLHMADQKVLEDVIKRDLAHKIAEHLIASNMILFTKLPSSQHMNTRFIGRVIALDAPRIQYVRGMMK